VKARAKGITNVKTFQEKAIQKERKSEAKKVQGRKPKVDLEIGRAKFCPKCQRAIPHANKKWGKNGESEGKENARKKVFPIPSEIKKERQEGITRQGR
jgi:hypothetical protein